MASIQISDEKLAAALITNGTVKQTAAVVGISEKQIYNRMKDEAFKEIFDYAQADLLAGTLAKCQSHITNAIDTVAAIMTDTTINAQTRLQAAQTIISQSVKLYEITDRIKDKAEDRNWLSI